MSNYYNQSTLQELLEQFYRNNNRSDSMKEIQLIASWKKVVGSYIDKHTIKLSVRNGVLFVKVNSDSLRTELQYAKSILIKHLNKEVGKDILKDIVLR